MSIILEGKGDALPSLLQSNLSKLLLFSILLGDFYEINQLDYLLSI